MGQQSKSDGAWREGWKPDIAEQLETGEKLRLPRGGEDGVPLPVRSGGGGGFDGAKVFVVHLMEWSEPDD